MRVMIQLRSSPPVLAAAGFGPREDAITADVLTGVDIDRSFAPVLIPTPVRAHATAAAFALRSDTMYTAEPEDATYVVRGSIPDEDPGQAAQTLIARHPDVVGVFSDPVIETCPVCPSTPPVGSDADVADRLGVEELWKLGMDGRGVAVAVVDTGINESYLRGRGHHTAIDVARSWTPAAVPSSPGAHPVSHGTMCAFDVGIAAPRAQLLDMAVLLSSTRGPTMMSGLLTDALAAYGRLLIDIRSQRQDNRALVVSNSWGMFDPKWDFPIGNPGNYSDNAAHPFNIIVASLERAGADVLFAAGNCGTECPDARCQFGPTPPVCGANSHPAVLSVAGIDIDNGRVGYSSRGPGRLDPDKPDIAAYTHFAGSGVYPADGGTSAACPVAAGVVAAVRSRFSAPAVSPKELRALLYKTSVDLGGKGFDAEHGWGALSGDAVGRRLVTAPPRPA